MVITDICQTKEDRRICQIHSIVEFADIFMRQIAHKTTIAELGKILKKELKLFNLKSRAGRELFHKKTKTVGRRRELSREDENTRVAIKVLH